jgi:hypothetical protein
VLALSGKQTLISALRFAAQGPRQKMRWWRSGVVPDIEQVWRQRAKGDDADKGMQGLGLAEEQHWAEQ